MSMTPGPWIVSPDCNDDEGWNVTQNDGDPFSQCITGLVLRKEDAIAIAALPDLIAALIRCEQNCTNDGVGQQARAALNKAGVTHD